jgi:hypothetical protein
MRCIVLISVIALILCAASMPARPQPTQQPKPTHPPRLIQSPRPAGFLSYYDKAISICASLQKSPASQHGSVETSVRVSGDGIDVWISDHVVDTLTKAELSSRTICASRIAHALRESERREAVQRKWIEEQQKQEADRARQEQAARLEAARQEAERARQEAERQRQAEQERERSQSTAVDSQPISRPTVPAEQTQKAERATQAEGRRATYELAPDDILASRIFAGPHGVPPRAFAAYGIVAFPQTRTPDTLKRYEAVCNAYISTLLPPGRLSVPLSEQMVTVWPVDDDDIPRRLPEDNAACGTAIAHYDLLASLRALREARNKEHIALSGVGPYLLAWAPAAKKGEKDAIVLISDLSSATTPKQFQEYFRAWRHDIEQNSQLWRHGWSIADIRIAIRDWANKWGATILSIGHAAE